MDFFSAIDFTKYEYYRLQLWHEKASINVNNAMFVWQSHYFCATVFPLEIPLKGIFPSQLEKSWEQLQLVQAV